MKASPTEESKSQRGKHSDRTVDVALAEFVAVRALISSRFQLQVTLLVAGITALGVLAGFVVQDSADRQLLLLIPVLGSSMSLLYSEQNRRIVLMGDYINRELWPHLLCLTASQVPSWEAHWQTRSARDQRGRRVWKALLFVGDLAPVLILLGASAVSLYVVQPPEANMQGHLALWWFGLVLTTLSVAFSGLAVWLARRSRGEAAARETQARNPTPVDCNQV